MHLAISWQAMQYKLADKAGKRIPGAGLGIMSQPRMPHICHSKFHFPFEQKSEFFEPDTEAFKKSKKDATQTEKRLGQALHVQPASSAAHHPEFGDDLQGRGRPRGGRGSGVSCGSRHRRRNNRAIQGAGSAAAPQRLGRGGSLRQGDEAVP